MTEAPESNQNTIETLDDIIAPRDQHSDQNNCIRPVRPMGI